MAVNRYYKGTPYQGSLYVPPVQFVAQALESAQKQFDVNYQFAGKLRNQYIQARPQDRVRANEIQADIQKRVDEVATKYNGDYSQASKDLYGLQRDISKMFSPGGEAAAIQQNYLTVQQSLENEAKRVEKGEVASEDLNLLRSFYDTKLPPTVLNPATGTYLQVAPKSLPKHYDTGKEFEEFMGKVKPREIERSYPTGKKTLDGYHEFKTEKYSAIDPNEVTTA